MSDFSSQATDETPLVGGNVRQSLSNTSGWVFSRKRREIALRGAVMLSVLCLVGSLLLSGKEGGLQHDSKPQRMEDLSVVRFASSASATRDICNPWVAGIFIMSGYILSALLLFVTVSFAMRSNSHSQAEILKNGLRRIHEEIRAEVSVCEQQVDELKDRSADEQSSKKNLLRIIKAYEKRVSDLRASVSEVLEVSN